MLKAQKLQIAFKLLKQGTRISTSNRFGFTSLPVTNKINNDITSNWTRNKSLLIPRDRLSTCTASEDSKEIGYSEYRKLQKSGVTVIDVREKDEIEKTGTIPGSLHIPLKEVEHALAESADDFKSKYGRRKPGEEDAVMFLCLKGGRSRKAMEKAVQMGYDKALSYKGGFEDYDRNTKK